MHFHHYTLLHLGEKLTEAHRGECLQGAFSQNKNELVLEFEGFYLRIGCHTPHTYAVPVWDYAKARKNVVDLFEAALEKRLIGARTLANERVLILELEEGYDFVLKMHGLKANVMLRKDGEVIELFNKQHEEDWNFEEIPGPFDPQAIAPEVERDEKAVIKAVKAISPIYEKYFGRRVYGFMEEGKEFSQAFHQVVEEAQATTYFSAKEKDRIKFFLFPPPSELSQDSHSSVEEGLQSWLKYTFQLESYRHQYKVVDREVSKPLKKYRKVYQSYLKNIDQLEKERNPEEIGHILMANLHQIEPNTKKVVLEDFYHSEPINIKLDPQLNAQENAKKYYDKHKTRKARLLYLKEQLEDIENKYLEAEEAYEDFSTFPHPRDLSFGPGGFDPEQLRGMKQFFRKFRKEMKEAEEDRYPYRHFRRSGYEIFVGKNARNNDELSFKFAHKNDTWLHAKDVTGSHVIIRHRAGRDLPEEVLEYAAQLAAYYSKRKTDTLVPVQYTPRKYIRKRKGDPPGMVVVDREKVIMVEPVRN